MLQHPMLLSPLSCQLRLEIHSQAQETPVHRGKRPQSRKEAVEFRPDVRGVGRNQGTWTLRSAAAARTSPTHARSSRDCVSQMSPQAKRPKKKRQILTKGSQDIMITRCANNDTSPNRIQSYTVSVMPGFSANWCTLATFCHAMSRTHAGSILCVIGRMHCWLLLLSPVSCKPLATSGTEGSSGASKILTVAKNI